MPLSENLKYFIQNMFLSPQQQWSNRQHEQAVKTDQSRYEDAMRQQQAQFQAQQQHYNNQDENAYNKEQVDLITHGFTPAGQQSPGGPSLNGPAATDQESPGQAQNPVATAPGGDMSSIAPLLHMFGMQGAASQAPNQANQMPSGETAPSSRVGGGNPIAPTTFDFLHKGQKQTYNMPAKLAGSDVFIPEDVRAAFGGQASIHANDEAQATALRKMIFEHMYPDKKAGDKPDDKADLQKSAAQLTAKDAGLTGSFNRITDLPLEQQENGWTKHADLLAGAIGKADKQAKLDMDLEKKKKMEEARGSDSAVLDLLHRDPMYFNHKNIPDKDQYNRILTASQNQGLRLPTKEYTQKIKDKVDVADEIQIQSKRIQTLAEQVGYKNFGAMIGRMKIAEGKAGSPVITWGKSHSVPGTPQAALEQELRAHLNILTAQEAQMFGGGRTAVQMFNVVKNTSPQQYMSQPIFQGALRATYNRAQVSKNAARRFAFGDSDESSAMQGMVSGDLPRDHFVGEKLYHAGSKKEYTVKRVLPGNKIETEEE